jgi:hypothetical protein
MPPKGIGLLLVAIAAVAASTVAHGFTIDIAVNVSSHISERAASDFAGFSVEVHCFPLMALDGATGKPRTSYINLLSYLTRASGGKIGPNVRIGGNSADQS